MTLPLNVHKNSSDAMQTILDLHFPEGTILDVNHSKGVFYKKVSRNVIGVDIRPMATIVANNKSLPFAKDSVDIGVADPPYKRGPRDTKYTERYGEAPYTTGRVTQQYYDLLPELLRVSRKGMIIKAQDDTDGHRFHHRMFALVSFIKSLTNLEPHDIFYLVRNGIMENNIKGRQRHFSANCISYFLVYRWSKKYPFSPVRF
jgi:hypothetical protein